MSSRHRALVLVNGTIADPAATRGRLARLGAPVLVVAADGGARHAPALGLGVDVLVGDFDSLGADEVARLEAAGAEVERHPAAKDETDLELAIAAALARGAGDVVLVGVLGARADHAMANLLLLAAPRPPGVRIRAFEAGLDVFGLAGGESLALESGAGALVSLLPVGAPARGVRTRGLRWSLERESLPLGTPRGMSNVVETPPAEVSLEEGHLLVFAEVLP